MSTLLQTMKASQKLQLSKSQISNLAASIPPQPPCKRCGEAVVRKNGDPKVYDFCSQECQNDDQDEKSHLNSLTVQELYAELQMLKNTVSMLEEEKRNCCIQLLHLQQQSEQKDARIMALRKGKHTANSVEYEQIEKVFGINSKLKSRIIRNNQQKREKEERARKEAKKQSMADKYGVAQIPKRRSRATSNASSMTMSTQRSKKSAISGTTATTSSSSEIDSEDDHDDDALRGFTLAFRKRILESAASTTSNASSPRRKKDAKKQWKKTKQNVYGYGLKSERGKTISVVEQLNAKFASMGSNSNGSDHYKTSHIPSSASSVSSQSSNQHRGYETLSPAIVFQRQDSKSSILSNSSNNSSRSTIRQYNISKKAPKAQIAENILAAYESPETTTTTNTGKRRPRSLSMAIDHATMAAIREKERKEQEWEREHF